MRDASIEVLGARNRGALQRAERQVIGAPNEVLNRVAFLGLGTMGVPIAANLCRKGLEVTVWNRTASKAAAFAVEHGAREAATPAAADAQATITMVVDAPEVEEVLFGPYGAVEAMCADHLVIDMSSVAPTASRALAARLADRGIRFVDAPVSGSRPKAEQGALWVIAGGEPADVARARPIFRSTS